MGTYLAGGIRGYELKAFQSNESNERGECEGGEEGEAGGGEECACDSLVLYVLGLEVYQLISATVELEGELDCANGTL